MPRRSGSTELVHFHFLRSQKARKQEQKQAQKKQFCQGPQKQKQEQKQGQKTRQVFTFGCLLSSTISSMSTECLTRSASGFAQWMS